MQRTAGSGPTQRTPTDEGACLVLLCGTSSTGKSTVAGWLQQALAARVISLDAINAERGLDGGQGIPLDEWARTNEEAYRRAQQDLAAGRTVVIDDTAALRFLRERWRAVAEEVDAAFVLLHIDAAPDTVRARLLGNRRAPTRPDVPDAVMAEHLSAFEPPEADEGAVHVQSEDMTPQAVVAAVREVRERHCSA